MPQDTDVAYNYPIDDSKTENAIKTDVATQFGLQESQVSVRSPTTFEQTYMVDWLGSYTRICVIQKEGFAETADTVRTYAQV